MKKIIDFTLQQNEYLNGDTVLLTLYSEELPELRPGQFVNVKVDHSPNTYLRRPISVHDVDPERGLLYLFIKIVGDGTYALSKLKVGDRLNIILPLGNQFPIPDSGKSLLLGGGCGVAPLLYLAKEINRAGGDVTMIFGTRSKDDILRKGEYEKYGRIYYTTEDGSCGEKGYITQHSLLEKEEFDNIFCCGPDAMMRAVAIYAKERGVNCYFSLENTMACGIGACLCCVTETKEGHKCVCTDGAIFNLDDLTWQI